jgi:hypothetical protein
MKKSELQQIIKEEFNKILNEAFVNDKGELEDFTFGDEVNKKDLFRTLGGLEKSTSSTKKDSKDDLIVKYFPEYYQNEKRYKFFYCEKGLADDFDTKDGKKVKYIVGYSHFLNLPNDKKWILDLPDPFTELDIPPGLKLDPDSCYAAEMDVIGYIFSKNGIDIETEYEEEDLWNAFYDSLGA